MKLTFSQILNFGGGIMLPRKSVVNTFALIKIEGCHFTCKTANKRLHVEEWVKMAKMNKDDPFPCLVIP